MIARLLAHAGVMTALVAPLAIVAASNAQCSTDQAPHETVGNPPQPLFVPPNQNFHLNVSALSSYPSQQAADIIKGLTEWAGVNGITFDYVSAAPGPGVITVQSGSNFGSTGSGQWNSGGSGAANNQITGGTISFDLGYIAPGGFPGFDANLPNADNYLVGLAAHEMGHILGLDDIPNASTSGQTSTSVMGGQIGTNNNGMGNTPPNPTSTAPTDCDKSSVSSGSNGTGGGGGGSSSGDGSGDGSGGGGSAGDGGGGDCGGGYQEFDDSTNTVTYYGYC